jgi:hypothetical protein
MKDYFNYILLILSFLIINASSIIAQDSIKVIGEKHNSKDTIPILYNSLNDSTASVSRIYNPSTTISTAHELRENALVVLLRTNGKRLKELGVLSRSTEISVKQKAGILRKMEAIKTETILVNFALIESFNNSYRFSEVYFIYDNEVEKLKSGTRKGIFVSENGKVDETIELAADNFMICNYTLVSASNDSEGLVIYDAQMNRLKPPFPTVSVSGSSGFNMLLQILTSDENYHRKAITKNVEKLQRSLYLLL